eukprot:377287_1
MSDSEIDITDLLSDDLDDIEDENMKNSNVMMNNKQIYKTIKSRRIRSKNKPKVRTRPQSAILSNEKSLRHAMKRFEKIQRAQTQNKKRKNTKNARYNPKQWFDATEIKGIEDFREENYQLRLEINNYKNDITKLKS